MSPLHLRDVSPRPSLVRRSAWRARAWDVAAIVLLSVTCSLALSLLAAWSVRP